MFHTKKLLIIVAAVVASAWLMFLIDDGMGFGWSHAVIRNWQQFGLFNLHGQLVYNSGGYDIAEHPQIYKGMSPVCFYAAYFVTVLFSWTGLNTLSFHVLLALAVLWGAWKLLGQNHFALMVAVTAILCPGYLCWQKLLDPNAISVLPVIPYTALVLAILQKQKLNALRLAGLLVLTVVFISLNWTTGWVCGPCIFLLLGTPGVNRRRLFWFTVLVVMIVPLMLLGSFAAKSSGDKAGVAQFIGGYTWGNIGYGKGLTTSKAFVRLAFYNGIGLFPLWLALAHAIAVRQRRRAPFSWLMFTPLALTIADLAIMRNYFGHHPWMAGPVLLVGIIFSIALLCAPYGENVPNEIPFALVPASAFLGFVYCLMVLALLRANETNEISLVGLVRHHTVRSEVIAVVKNRDPETARLAVRIDSFLDRHIIVVDDFQDLGAGRSIILSSVKLDAPLTLIAQSSARPQSWLNKIADWFKRSIARRNPGDRMELSDAYFLYELKR